ncbi:MAG: response regulator [Clostridia bacterium]|nr:response regulator [Clostridia bacterium]
MSGRKKILVVDDQYGIRALLTMALDKYDVKEACNGRQALELARTWEPDLMIIDMKMPILNGAETIMSLKNIDWKCKVLVMTAYDNNYRLDNSQISGFISKPFDIDELISMVDDILQNSEE